MDRELKKIQTPNGKELVLKAYITARERNQLRGIYLKGYEVDQENPNKSKIVNTTIFDEAEQKLVELIVVSYGEFKDNIYSSLLDQSPEEYDFVLLEAGKIQNGNLTQAK